ncbi:hypothetical protein D3C76_1251870 [compost metagenome]
MISEIFEEFSEIVFIFIITFLTISPPFSALAEAALVRILAYSAFCALFFIASESCLMLLLVCTNADDCWSVRIERSEFPKEISADALDTLSTPTFTSSIMCFSRSFIIPIETNNSPNSSFLVDITDADKSPEAIRLEILSVSLRGFEICLVIK